MSEHQPGPETAPQEVVGQAIQQLVAARLGRGFLPLVVLLGAGLARLFVGASDPVGTTALLVGAPLTAVAMLAYGLRITQHAFGRGPTVWMSWAMVGSVVPPFFALYVFGWKGLRMVFGGGGLLGFGTAALFTFLGGWVMRSWMRVVEVERLARVMQLNVDSGGSGL